MPGYNGAGIWDIRYNFVTDAANGIKILASRQDQMWGDVKNSFQNVLTLDGQTTPTANIPFNSKKITGLANGTAPQDAATFGQINANLSPWITETNAATWVNATQVKFVGVDLTARYIVGTKVAFLDNGIQRYAYVTAKAFAADTTLTLALDDATAMVGPTTVFQYSIFNANHLALPVTSLVMASRITTAQSFASGSNKVQLNGEVLDLLGEFDPVTNFRFTPLCAGRYFVSAYCNFTNTGSGFTTGINCFIFKTGVQNMIGSPGSGATTNVPVTSTVSGAVYLNVGDYLELFATSTIAANNTVGIGSSMTIVRID